MPSAVPSLVPDASQENTRHAYAIANAMAMAYGIAASLGRGEGKENPPKQVCRGPTDLAEQLHRG